MSRILENAPFENQGYRVLRPLGIMVGKYGLCSILKARRYPAAKSDEMARSNMFVRPLVITSREGATKPPSYGTAQTLTFSDLGDVRTPTADIFTQHICSPSPWA